MGDLKEDLIEGKEINTLGSTAIDSFSYEWFTETLTVKFISGARYEYHGVDEATALGLANASSHGRYFARLVRGYYSYNRL
jgi:hypothetical protein